jgi:hypothetical protein
MQLGKPVRAWSNLERLASCATLAAIGVSRHHPSALFTRVIIRVVSEPDVTLSFVVIMESRIE